MRDASYTATGRWENWTPVINNKWKHNRGNKLTTLFIDNLPDDLSSVWVRNLFSKFGRVRDLFLPRKKSKITGLRFGFVRFARRDEAISAIAKANGLWIWGNKLVVKLARFEANSGDLQGKYMTVSVNKKRNNQQMGMHAYPPSYDNVSGHNGAVKGKYGRYSWRNRRKKEDIWMGKQNNVKKIWRKKDGSTSNASQTKSYLEALKANSWRKPNQPIHLKELGNEWLSRSVVAKLSPVRSMVLVQDQLRSLGYADIQVRAMGGDSIILTFSSSDVRDSMFSGGQMAWLKDWFLETYKWEVSTIKPRNCRLIWLNCYGLPIQLWNVHNFIKIGQYWGDVIQVSDDTIKDLSFAVGKVLVSTSIMEGINDVIEVECKGSIYKIRVMEEQLVVNTFLKADCSCNGCLIQIPASSNKVEEQKEENNEVEQNGVIKDNIEMELEANPADAANPVGLENSVEPVDDSFESKDEKSRVEDSGDVNEFLVVDNTIKEKLVPINNDCRQLVIVNGTSNNSVGYSSTGCGSVGMNRKYPKLVMCQQLETSLRDNRIYIQKALSNVCSNNESSWSVEAFNSEVLKSKERTTSNSKVKEIAKHKRKQKSIEEILGIPSTGKSKKGGKKNKQKKSVVFRAAIAEAALSVSSEGINNRNRILLNEAEAVLAVTKILGEDYSGDDEEIISKIMLMEERDDEWAAKLNDDLLIA